MRSPFALIVFTAALPGASSPAFAPYYLDIGPAGQSYALAADPSGNLFTASTAYEPSGREVIRIIKTSAAGDVLAQLDFGEDANDTNLQPVAAAVDHAGNFILVGNVNGSGLPLVAPILSHSTQHSAFLAKFDSLLQRTIFSTRLGGTMESFFATTTAAAVAVDGFGNIFVAGSTNVIDFPVTQGAFQTAPPVSNAFGAATFAFIAELPPDGSRLIFSTYFGGNNENCVGGSACVGAYGYTTPGALALDSQGNIVFAGSTTATDLPVTPGTLSQTCGCPQHTSVGFVAKLAAGGASLIWSTYLNSLTNEYSFTSVKSALVDSPGNLIVAGSTPAGFTATPGVIQPADPLGAAASGTNAGFIAKLDPGATRFLFSTYFGGGSINAMTPDGKGGVWLTGTSDPQYLPSAASTPALGPAFIADLAGDGQSVSFLTTAPDGAAGQALAAGPTVLGPSGSLLLPDAGPVSLAAITGSGTDHVTPFVAPYELVSLYGLHLGPATPVSAQVENGAVTNSIGGVQVFFDGVPAPLLYAGPTQINAVVPSSVTGRDITNVQVVSPDGRVEKASIPVRPTAPQVFHTADGSAAALNQDGTINTADNPAEAGSIVTFWATGAGLIWEMPPDGLVMGVSGNPDYTRLPVSVLTSGDSPTSLEILYAGNAPGDVAGVMQVNFRLPDPAPQSLSVVLQVGALASDAVGIYVHNR